MSDNSDCGCDQAQRLSAQVTELTDHAVRCREVRYRLARENSELRTRVAELENRILRQADHDCPIDEVRLASIQQRAAQSERDAVVGYVQSIAVPLACRIWVVNIANDIAAGAHHKEPK